jgi:hypothetical protein
VTEAQQQVMQALAAREESTAKQIADDTGLTVRKVASTIYQFVATGRAFVVGTALISGGRTINTYGLGKPANAAPSVKQTWLSPLL